MKTKIVITLISLILLLNSCGLEERTKIQFGIIGLIVIVIVLFGLYHSFKTIYNNFIIFFKNFFNL